MSVYTSVAVEEQQKPVKEGQSTFVSDGAPEQKDSLESAAFHNQFNEVEKAIANFTKHQPFNHHYAPNIHVNRNRNNFNNGGNNNSNSLRQHNAHNSGSNFAEGNGNNSMFSQPTNFSMTAQLKQQQHHQYLNQGMQSINRFKGNVAANGSSMGLSTAHPQQYVPSHLSEAPVYLEQNYSGMFHHGNDPKFNAFQGSQLKHHPDMLSSLRNSSPTFNSMGRDSFGNAPPIEQMNANPSFGLGHGTLQQASDDFIDKKLSMDESSSAYLENIWGNSKSLGGSASVWA